MQKQKPKVLKEKENVGFGLRIMRCHLSYYQAQNLWVLQPKRVLRCPYCGLFLPGVPGGAWTLLRVSFVGLSGLGLQHLAMWMRSRGASKEGQQSPVMPEVLEEAGLPHCLAFYLQSRISAPLCLT